MEQSWVSFYRSAPVPLPTNPVTAMELEQIKVSKAIRLTVQSVGNCSRTTFYRWMEWLQIEPDNGLISKSDLALLCVWGKAIKKTGSRVAAAKAVLDAKREWSQDELYRFAFDPNSTFQQIEVKHAS